MTAKQSASAAAPYTCLPPGFAFRCYVPLDPRMPCASAEPCALVSDALAFFPNFDRDVPAEEKAPVTTPEEAARVLAEGRAERRHVADLERTIEDQTAVAAERTAAAINMLREKAR